MVETRFEGSIRPETHAMIPIGIRAVDEDNRSEMIEGMGIIDTASEQCVINVGVLDEDLFTQQGDIALVDAIGRRSKARYQELLIRLMQDGTAREFRVPVYQMSLGQFPPRARIMLIGRTILNQGVLVYDGMKQKWSMTFSDG